MKLNNISVMFFSVLTTVRNDGLVVLVRKVFIHLRYRVRKYYSVEQKIFRKKDIKSRFTDIYLHNYWSNPESVSGSGSTLAYTENIRNKLPKLFEEYNIKFLLDAPCGDFNWMREVLKDCPDIEYIGGDIVDKIVCDNNSRYANERIEFRVIDIILDNLQYADMMIVRDCLFHLSFADISLFLENLSRSSIHYLLTTSYDLEGQFVNEDIETGGFREINLFKPPLNFPATALCCIDDWVPPFPRRKMCLFDVGKLPKSIK